MKTNPEDSVTTYSTRCLSLAASFVAFSRAYKLVHVVLPDKLDIWKGWEEWLLKAKEQAKKTGGEDLASYLEEGYGALVRAREKKEASEEKSDEESEDESEEESDEDSDSYR